VGGIDGVDENIGLLRTMRPIRGAGVGSTGGSTTSGYRGA